MYVVFAEMWMPIYLHHGCFSQMVERHLAEQKMKQKRETEAAAAASAEPMDVSYGFNLHVLWCTLH